ncbi:AMP-binding protein [Paraburkholderia caledonica]|uniref:AMP-binding protein n=1 Tax=Paraburkholderia caledonica TaxID=134536 RepID=UPI000380E5EB|nr:AMP-binding protein [Paraburkholderia caledonica]
MNIAHCLLTRSRSVLANPAVTCGDMKLNFAQLVDHVQCLSTALLSRYSLAKNDRVLIYSENCAEYLELMFAAWNAGLCVVPVNAKLHPREVAHIAKDSGSRLIATSDSHATALLSALPSQSAPAPILILGGDEYQSLLVGLRLPCCDVAPWDTAWIFYTSGTTGKPKGAAISHQALLFMSMAYHADVGRVLVGDTQLHAAPLSHASGLYAIPHLCAGGHQVVLQGFDVEEILTILNVMPRVSMFAAPTMLMRLQRAAVAGKGAGGNLETIIYGGGPMYVHDLEACLETFGPRLFQLYGQGECPMTIAGLPREAHIQTPVSRRAKVLASCGYPRTGVRIRVVDEADSDVPVGEAGQIVVSSPVVMSGYWENRLATESALRDGWLHTGDVGFFDEFGLLTLIDRSKDVMISGGTNIYPREIEDVVLDNPAVLECCVVGRSDPEWGEVPVAFVVLREGASVTAEDLDQACLTRIARFKRPREYRMVDALPKNSYGKVLKTELRKLLTSKEKFDA